MAQLYRTYMNPERRDAPADAAAPEGPPPNGRHSVSADMAVLRVESVPVVTVLEGIRRRAGADVDVVHEKGCPVEDIDRSGIESAVRAARAADVAIVVVGDQSGVGVMATVGEGIDSTECTLPGVQRELVEAVVDTGTPTVVVLSHGRPFVLGWMVERVPAIASAFFAGEEAGNAIASVLFGDADPGGRTPVGFPASAGAAPVGYARATVPTHTYFDGTARATFPFGHGLSYTSFAYDDLEIDAPEVPTDGLVRVSCTVTNTGGRDGEEVVQLYARDVVARTVRPARELKGFVRVRLARGEATRVTFELAADRFALWDPSEGWVVEPGKIELHVGASSEDIRLSGDVVLTGRVRRAGPERVLTTPVHPRPA
jgi:beta-glucosidase